MMPPAATSQPFEFMMTPLEEQKLLALKYKELLTNTRLRIRLLALNPNGEPNENSNHLTIAVSVVASAQQHVGIKHIRS